MADVANDGATGLSLSTVTAYDLIILDLLMPRMDGVEVLQELASRHPSQRILVLSALSQVDSKVKCLDLGADDYLAKPFSLDELLARVRARLRPPHRSRRSISWVGIDEPVTRVTPRLSVDPQRQEADAGDGPVALSRREFLLLWELARNAGKTVSKERLLSSVWRLSHDPGSNVVDVYVWRLRRKLGTEVIATVRGEGYRIDGN